MIHYFGDKQSPTGWFFDDKWTYSMTRIRIKYSLKRLKLTISTSRAFQNVICYIKIFKSVESSLGSLLILGHYTVLFGKWVKNKLAIHNFFIKNSTICRNDEIPLAFRRSFLPTTVLSSEFYNKSYFSVLVQISILGVFLWSTVTFIYNDSSFMSHKLWLVDCISFLLPFLLAQV